MVNGPARFLSISWNASATVEASRVAVPSSQAVPLTRALTMRNPHILPLASILHEELRPFLARLPYILRRPNADRDYALIDLDIFGSESSPGNEDTAVIGLQISYHGLNSVNKRHDIRRHIHLKLHDRRGHGRFENATAVPKKKGNTSHSVLNRFQSFFNGLRICQIGRETFSGYSVFRRNISSCRRNLLSSSGDQGE